MVTTAQEGTSVTFTFVSMTHFKEALQGQLPHRCPQVAPQGPSTACFLIPSQIHQRGSQMLLGAAEHPQLPPNPLGSQKEDPHTRSFAVLPFTVLFKAASLLVLLGGGALNASLPVAMDFPRSFLPCQMPHLGVCEQ